jgi:hypothetical protein
MQTLRLVDPDGYTVPGTVQTNVPDANVDKVRAHLLNDIAPAEAAKWANFGYDARRYRVAVDALPIKPVQPTTDFKEAVARFIVLIECQPGRRVVPRKGRWLAWQAVYGDLWTPDRVGEVPPQDRPSMRAIVSRINRQAFPGGALAASVTADQVKSLWSDDPYDQ